MENWFVIALGGTAIIALVVLIVFLMHPADKTQKHPRKKKNKQLPVETVEDNVQHVFDDAFRQELRNRGLLHFEKIINENAMFLQQDLRLTASQVNEYMKEEIKRSLGEEFAQYEQSITDAKQSAIESISKTQTAIEQQRDVLTKQLDEQFEASKAQLVAHFEENMADIVNHYIMKSIGDQIDLNDQLEFIIADLQANKKAIVEDISRGA